MEQRRWMYSKVEDARMIDREMTGWENGGKKEKKRNEKKKKKGNRIDLIRKDAKRSDLHQAKSWTRTKKASP